MHLYLLRHAEAADFYPDPERPLTTKGRQDSTALGSLLARQQIDLPETIWCSPYLRARETADCLLKGAETKTSVQVRDGLTPNDDPAHLLESLAAANHDLLIVGHNPHLSILAGLLLGGLDANVNVHYRKASLMRFERIQFYSNKHPPAWALDWMLAPKLYRPPY